MEAPPRAPAGPASPAQLTLHWLRRAGSHRGDACGVNLATHKTEWADDFPRSRSGRSAGRLGAAVRRARPELIRPPKGAFQDGLRSPNARPETLGHTPQFPGRPAPGNGPPPGRGYGRGAPLQISLSRSSVERPPQTPYGSRVRSAQARQVRRTGQHAQTRLAFCSRRRRDGPRSFSGWKKTSEPRPRQAAAACQSQCSANGAGSRPNSLNRDTSPSPCG
jgi:hypothetical protein